jgi:hypothetical protein
VWSIGTLYLCAKDRVLVVAFDDVAVKPYIEVAVIVLSTHTIFVKPDGELSE